MTLKRVDVGILSRYNPEKSTVTLLNADATVRLLDHALIDPGGKLTQKGLKVAENAAKKIAVLRKGIPFAKRAQPNPKALQEAGHVWHTGVLSKKPYMTDKSLLILGKPTGEMAASQGSPDLRQRVPSTISACAAAKDMVQLDAYMLQMIDLAEADFTTLVWMVDTAQTTKVPIQLMYYDFIKDRYPSCRFYGSKGIFLSPLQARVTNRGLQKNIVALIQPVRLRLDKEQLPDFGGDNV